MPLQRCLQMEWHQAVTVKAEVQTLRERVTMSRYMCTAYLVMNVSLHDVRMKIPRPSSERTRTGQTDGRHDGEIFHGDTADNPMITFERMARCVLNKYHNVIIPLAIKQTTNAQCLVQVSIRCSEHYSLCHRHCEDIEIVTATNKITNHSFVFHRNTQQNTAHIPSPATQYIVSISNLFICATGLSQPSDQPDTSVLNVAGDKG